MAEQPYLSWVLAQGGWTEAPEIVTLATQCRDKAAECVLAEPPRWDEARSWLQSALNYESEAA